MSNVEVTDEMVDAALDVYFRGQNWRGEFDLPRATLGSKGRHRDIVRRTMREALTAALSKRPVPSPVVLAPQEDRTDG